MLKSLHKNDTQTIPYIATKNWNFSNVANEELILMEHSGSDGLPVAIEYLDYEPISILISYGCNLAKEQQDLDKVISTSGLKTTGIFYPELDLQNPDGTYQRIIYSQIATTFYNKYRDPTKMWGLEEIDFEKSQTKRFISDKFKMFKIPQVVFGEKILENTVVLYDTTTDNDYIITDDGHCNLFAGTNLFSRQQEIRYIPNDFELGYNYTCDAYNNNTGSPLTPLTPINLTVISGSAILNWNSSSNDADYFAIQRSLEGVIYSDFDTSMPETYTDTTVTSSVSGSTYWYQVAAVNVWGTSSFSNTASITFTSSVVPPSPTPPLVPINLIVISGSAILNWDSSSNDQDYYGIQKSLNGIEYSDYAASIPNTYIDTNVSGAASPGNTYWYQVAAVNAYGTSSFSNTASITFIELPPPPPGPPAFCVVPPFQSYDISGSITKPEIIASPIVLI